MTYSSAILADSPVAYFKFDETSGTTFAEAVGGYDATLTGSATVGTTGLVDGGKAVTFPGDNNPAGTDGGYATASSSFPQLGTSFSFEAVIKVSSLTSPSLANGYQGTIISRDYNSTITSYRFGFLGAGVGEYGRPGISLYSSTASGNQLLADGRVDDGATHVVVVTASPTGQSAPFPYYFINIYIDGILNTSNQISQGAVLTGTYAPVIGGVRQEITTDTTSLTDISRFQGILDDLAVFNTALTPSQIRAHAVAAGVLMTVDGATATIDIAAGAGTPTLDPNMAASGATATISVNAGAGTGTITSSGLSPAGATAVVNISAGAGNATVGSASSVPGDYFITPIELSGLSGALSVDLMNSSVEAAEPTASQTFTRSIWLKIQPSVGGSFTITSGETSTFDHSLDLFDGETFADLNLLSSSDWINGTSTSAASITYSVGEIGPYFVRVRNVSTDNASLPLTWSLTTRSPVLIQEISTTSLDSTPASVQVSVVNADPAETVTFNLVGVGDVLQAVADSSGIISYVSVPIPALTAGTYTLTATGSSSGRTDTDSFQVLNDPIARPTSPTADASPTPVPQTGVRKWVLQDPVSGGAQYTFPINPSKMKPPFAPRYVDVEHTTSPEGIPVLWEGVARAFEWEFSGYLETEAFAAALLDFYNLNHRFFLIDHRNRAWIVLFTDLDLQPRRNIEQPYAHDYTIKALIFGEGVQLA